MVVLIKIFLSLNLTSRDGNDYGEGIARLLSDRFSSSRSSTMTVNDVHIFLDQIASDKKEQKVTSFANFVHKLTLVEFKWLTRLILKDLKLGINEKDVFAGKIFKFMYFKISRISLFGGCFLEGLLTSE